MITFGKGSTAKLRGKKECLEKELVKKTNIIREKVREHVYSKVEDPELINYFSKLSAQSWLKEKYNDKAKEIILDPNEQIEGKLVIENFSKLEKVKIQGEPDFRGGLSEIEIKNCEKLIYLDCSNNVIGKLVITGCPNLKELDISSQYRFESGDEPEKNTLYKIPDLSNLCALEKISIADNKLVVDVLDLTNNPLLIEITCSANKLKEINVSNCKKLRKFYCGGNLFEKLNLENNLELEELRIGNNNFSEQQDLSFLSHLVNLKILQLGKGRWGEREKLKYVYSHFKGSLEPLKSLEKLEKLDISDTGIFSILGGENYPDCLRKNLKFSYLPNLKEFITEEGNYVDILELRQKICEQLEIENELRIKEGELESLLTKNEFENLKDKKKLLKLLKNPRKHEELKKIFPQELGFQVLLDKQNEIIKLERQLEKQNTSQIEQPPK